MKTTLRKQWMRGFNPAKGFKTMGLCFIFSLGILCSNAQIKGHCDCSPSFGALSVYDVLQPGSTFGFGLEAGKWNKDAARFSYFLGTKMQWMQQGEGLSKANGAYQENTRFTLYVKGQFRIVNRFYLVVSPGFVNLSAFETTAGLRYVFPISRVIGIGLEPSYSIVQQKFSINTNLHIAL